jgi:5'-nucleotidase
MPLILITNDDGVHSPGLQAAAEAVAGLGDLLIAAPHTQQTGMSRALAGGDGAGIIDRTAITVRGQPHPAYAVHASPALAVVYALFELAPRRPDLCISGINYGENIGLTIAASGTVGAALEASACGIPALAVSRGAPLSLHRAADYGALDWSTAQQITARLAERILRRGLPPDVAALNANVPDDATERTPIRLTVQSRQAHVYFTRPAPRDFAAPFALPLTSTVDPATLEPDSDIRAYLLDGAISVSPLTGWVAAPVLLADVARALDL